jgi:hypothetical protein
MKSGMRVLFPIRLDVTCAEKYINANNEMYNVTEMQFCCPVTGLQFQAGTMCPKHTDQLWGLLRFLCRGDLIQNLHQYGVRRRKLSAPRKEVATE